MFVEVAKPRRSTVPWATIAIIVLCVAAYLWLASLPEPLRAGVLRRWGTVPANLFEVHAATLRQWFQLHLARLFTALFIHVDWLHLTGNMLFLMIFGISAERVLGSARFLLLFLVGGALADLIGALTLAKVNAPIVGSSGAVSAIVGAYFALFPRAKLGLVIPLGLFLEFVRVPAAVLIGVWILLQFVFTFIGPAFGAVAWWAHIAGFVIGIVFALLSRGAINRRMRG